MKKSKNMMSTKKLVLGAILTAFVIILQLMGNFALFGPFSTAVALIPIAIGAATCGMTISGWLGFIFGVVVLVSGGASLFLAFNIPGTIITVLAKGIACGLAAGFVYKLLAKTNSLLAVIVSSVTCPIVNTGVFLVGCSVFFLKDAAQIASTAGSSGNGMGVFIGFAMANFLIEIITNLILSPVIVRILAAGKKT
jgi:uncharacterized membrane protein